MLLVIVITVVLFIRRRPADADTRSILVAGGGRRRARFPAGRAPRHQQAQRARPKSTGMIQETMSGIAVAKSSARKATVYGEFQTSTSRRIRVHLRQGFVFSGIFPLLTSSPASAPRRWSMRRQPGHRRR